MLGWFVLQTLSPWDGHAYVGSVCTESYQRIYKRADVPRFNRRWGMGQYKASRKCSPYAKINRERSRVSTEGFGSCGRRERPSSRSILRVSTLRRGVCKRKKAERERDDVLTMYCVGSHNRIHRL